MTFIHAILSGLLTAAIGGVMGGAAVWWISILSKEHGPDVALGRAYGLMFGAIAGAMAGFAIGAVGALVLPFPTYAKGLGVGICAIIGLGVLSAGVDWFFGDRPARINGKLVYLDYEVRMPKGAAWPPAPENVESKPQVFLARDTKTRGSYGLDLSEVTRVDGRWTVKGAFPLETRHGNHSLNFALAKDAVVYFYLDGKPSARNLDWSEWMEASWDAGKARPTAEESFTLRYRLRYRPEEVDVPVPMGPSSEEQAADRFSALTPSSPVREWMRFLRYDGPKEQVAAAKAMVEGRQEELTGMMRSVDAGEREEAMEAVPYLDKPRPQVQAAVLREGRLIADELRKVEGKAPDLRDRFNSWGPAWWAVNRKVDGFDSGSLREIWALAKPFGAEGAMGEVELNARVMLEKLETPQGVR